MTDNIINLSDHKPQRTLAGEAICLHCRHKFVACVDIEGGTPPFLECSQCGLMKCVFVYPALPNEGEIVFICNCGCEIGYHTLDGFVCCKCGQISSREEILGE